MANDIDFKFTYLALKLLGKNLYSNAWAALSELVANGLDAEATKVYVYIDMREKRDALVEVFDNGCGMSESIFKEKYVSIGRNRREDQDNSENVMGRKGIGKLAALYLSRHYFISSKTKKGPLLTYEMNFSQKKESSNDEKPKLKIVDNIAFANKEFNNYDHGTMVHMEDVDLKGYADFSVQQLNNVLSDFFSVDSLKNQKIYFKVVRADEEMSQDFKLVKKEIPFKNMAQIICFDSQTYKRLHERYQDNKYKLPYKNFSDKCYEGTTNVKMDDINKEMGKRLFTSPKNNKEKSGQLTGWIGIHSSIDSKTAKKNDNLFKKSKLYNPLKLRIYVRNKLAISNFLPIIKNTQVFSNFIEGEIGFDILDDNDFPDIATTSRQNMDENDERIIFLAENMKKEVTKLIRYRLDIKKQMNKKEVDLTDKSSKEAKKILSQSIDNKIEKIIDKIPENNNEETKFNRKEELNELKYDVLKHVKGSNIKNKYMIFFSHSRKNKKFIDFYFYLLKDIGVREEEMFYTSKSDKPQININDRIIEISKDNISNTDTAIFFYTTEEFMDSQYCMFEGGAVWATKTPDDYILTYDDYTNIPDYLDISDKFRLELNKDTDILQGDVYNRVVQTLNYIIDHLNNGRAIKQEPKIPNFGQVDFPDQRDKNHGIMPCIDKKIIEFWDAYIDSDVQEKAINQGYILGDTLNFPS